MRLFLLFLTVLRILSCSNTDTIVVSTDSLFLNKAINTTSNKSERQLLIDELKRLHAIFASKDKEKIADIFQFPLSDTTVGIYIDDSTFNAQHEINGGSITRTMFIHHYSNISESLQTDQITQLFNKIDPDRLLQRDTLEHEAIVKAEPCYHFYGVGIEKDIVTLTEGTSSNRNYKNKSVSENEIPENDSSFCEHVLWWVFRFDGKKLQFKNVSGAG